MKWHKKFKRYLYFSILLWNILIFCSQEGQKKDETNSAQETQLKSENENLKIAKSFDEIAALIQQRLSIGKRLEQLKQELGDTEFNLLINFENSDGFTLLTIAISVSNIEAIDDLLRYKPNINHMPKNKMSALSLAVTQIIDNIAILKKVFHNSNADANELQIFEPSQNKKQTFQASLLFNAIFVISSAKIKFLLEEKQAKTYIGDVCLSDCAQRLYKFLKKNQKKIQNLPEAFNKDTLQHLLIIRNLLKKYEESQRHYFTDEILRNRQNKLFLAIEYEKDFQQTLLKNYSAISLDQIKKLRGKPYQEIQDGLNYIQVTFWAIVNELRKKIPNVTNYLRLYKIKFSAEKFKQLLEYEDDEGKTLLIAAVEYESIPFIDELIKYKVNINQVTRNGNTALQCAIQKNNPEIIQRLKEAAEKQDLELNTQKTTSAASATTSAASASAKATAHTAIVTATSQSAQLKLEESENQHISATGIKRLTKGQRIQLKKARIKEEEDRQKHLEESKKSKDQETTASSSSSAHNNVAHALAQNAAQTPVEPVTAQTVLINQNQQANSLNADQTESDVELQKLIAIAHSQRSKEGHLGKSKGHTKKKKDKKDKKTASVAHSNTEIKPTHSKPKTIFEKREEEEMRLVNEKVAAREAQRIERLKKEREIEKQKEQADLAKAQVFSNEFCAWLANVTQNAPANQQTLNTAANSNS